MGRGRGGGIYRARAGRMHGSKYAHENDLGENGEGTRGVIGKGYQAWVVVVVVVVVHMTLHLMLQSNINLRKFL